MSRSAHALHFPVQTPPADGQPLEIAPGIFWVRFAIPFALTHVNIYLLRDSDGWVAIDTSAGTDRTHAAWTEIFRFIGGPKSLKRLIITHHHVDHSGAAGWLMQATGCDVLMAGAERDAMARSLVPHAPDRAARLVQHLRWLGCAEPEAQDIPKNIWRIADYSGPLAGAPQVIAGGDRLIIGGREWLLRTGNGHAPESIMLHCEAENILIAGDQILPTISPFIGVFMEEKDHNPLADYMGFLEDAAHDIPADTLVLPGHGLPFAGAGPRLRVLHEHHVARCDLVLETCHAASSTPRALVDRLFRRNLDGMMSMALAETMAHVNYLVAEGRLAAETESGALRLKTV
ncbi:MAG: MBL fold metallo-hydrolase [Candidatus Competibacter phosphatis]